MNQLTISVEEYNKVLEKLEKVKSDFLEEHRKVVHLEERLKLYKELLET